MQLKHTTRFLTAVLSVTALAATAPADAQQVTGTLVGQTAGDDVSLLLGDVTGAWGAGRLRPVASLQAYMVAFDAGTGTNQLYAVQPAVGLRSQSRSGFVQGLVGYSFQTVDEATVSPFFGGGEDGVVTTLHAEHWGTGALALQGIATYNWGGDFLWSRLRGTGAVLRRPSGTLQVGAEAGWQGNTGDGGYEATQVGPVVRWVTDRWSGAIAGGWKGLAGAQEDTWYVGAEISVPLMSR